MIKKTSKILSIFVLLLTISSANAALVKRLNGQALYDDSLNITWLADGKLGTTMNFGVNGIDFLGRMNWSTANNWIRGMNSANYLGINRWRMASTSPINGSYYQTTRSNDASTDYGFGLVGIGWQDSNNNPVSEMGHLYYSTFTDLGVCGASGCTSIRQTGVPVPDIQNGYFSNLSNYTYWTDQTPSNFSNTVIEFSFFNGEQGLSSTYARSYNVLAVTQGDVFSTSVPEPPMLILLGTLIAGFMGRRKMFS